jgi:LDH2 family malate/lactate/ureidoglycolate dehydrogenase
VGQPIRVRATELVERLGSALLDAGASAESAEAAVRALMHASRLGVDSHGARLVAHYASVLRSGRLNPRPKLEVTRRGAAAAVVDGDDGLGHYAAYRATAEAVTLAREAGIGAVGVVRSSHYGAAGAYALAAAEAGMIGFATTNADSIVALHGGAAPFHGTNPLAFAAPSGGPRPWLLDMATSSIPWNRVLLYRALGTTLPEGVAGDGAGAPTRDPDAARLLLPLGGTDFGFKGAALAGVATILAAVLQGATLDHAMIPMTGGGDMATPRGMGHFVMAVDPAFFGGREAFETGMRAYLAALRAAPARPGEAVMAPGDREWRVEAERERDGIPLDPETAAFLGFDAEAASAAEARG